MTISWQGPLVPDSLKELWQRVERKECDEDAYCACYERLLAEYRKAWTAALLLAPHRDLREGLLAELAEFLGCADLAEVERRWGSADAELGARWREKVAPDDRRSVEGFYDESEAQLLELLRWHALVDDNSPLAYVTALHFARQRGCRSYLDFGAGVGSGGVLFARHGFDVTLADIAAPVLRFSRWRLARRGLPARVLDLKEGPLPTAAFDFVTAMDVFEHLFDPVGAVEDIWKSLRPGGYFFGRFHADEGPEQPGHIVRDFGPTFRRMEALGLAPVWQDGWLWGHQVFQKV
jgi:SAM-dependent methyltransferase